ncbi:hypothetical protein C8R41DRAFT_870530 [Lentinula lateritia]|uniref:Uncharacterized protein n=1 Tax=Lentinula lateritia TaxID=40482 RepID=A0ABQ8V376_9AGAR|nr:hypothetical protein C8R41DRAFT_870530 [Lentinula lateritia]
MKYPTITATTAVVLASVALQVPAAAIPIPGLPFTPGFINDPTIPSMPTIQNIPAVPYTPTNMYNPAAIPGMPDLTGLGGIHTNDEGTRSQSTVRRSIKNFFYRQTHVPLNELVTERDTGDVIIVRPPFE